MQNKNVCPNCGQLYDTDLEQCPLCGTEPQVMEAKEDKRRPKDPDHPAETSGKAGADAPEHHGTKVFSVRPQPISASNADKATKVLPVIPKHTEVSEPPIAATPAPARDGRGPMPTPPPIPDHGRIPRAFLGVSCLLLSVSLLLGSSYLLWKHRVVALSIYENLAKPQTGAKAGASQPQSSSASADSKTAQSSTDVLPTRHEGERVPCESITLGQTELTFSEAGEQVQLSVTRSPADTTDDRSFTSSDLNVVKVSPVGIVTAVAPGEAVITVRCGEQSAECRVKCSFDVVASSEEVSVDVAALELNKSDMSFFAAGENFVLSVTNIPTGTPVSWKAEDESVCTVDATGRVTAVSGGTTYVVATVGKLSAKCIVRCQIQ